jgi:hypothetical protein
MSLAIGNRRPLVRPLAGAGQDEVGSPIAKPVHGCGLLEPPASKRPSVSARDGRPQMRFRGTTLVGRWAARSVGAGDTQVSDAAPQVTVGTPSVPNRARGPFSPRLGGEIQHASDSCLPAQGSLSVILPAPTIPRQCLCDLRLQGYYTPPGHRRQELRRRLCDDASSECLPPPGPSPAAPGYSAPG